MDVAVLFLVFNRPEPTRRVFEAIRASRPSRLYIAADGPRTDRAGEAERCAEVRAIATNIDWPCKVETLFRDENLGCKHGVAQGIDWFFVHEPEGIILEDDVLPHSTFFLYCKTLLEHYRDDPSIAMISGCNLVGDCHDSAASYFFSRYLHVWGWASWRRAWSAYDVDMGGWPSPAASAQLAKVLGGRSAAISYWREVFDRMARGEIDTWDYQWVFASWMRDMLAIIPAETLIENIGFGDGATHTTGDLPAIARARAVAMAFPLQHAPVAETGSVDAIIERVAMDITPTTNLRATLRRSSLLRWIAGALRSEASSR